MKNKLILIVLIFLILVSCVGTGSKGVFGTGVSIALDPRSLGTQIDDSIMQKNLAARLALKDKKYILSINTKVLDGRIFITGKVNDPEEKLQITKVSWETAGVRSVKNDIKIKEEFNFKRSAKDLLITSQLRTALIFNKNISLKLDESDKIKIKKMIKTLSIKDIVSLISKNKDISKKDIYNFCLSLKKWE